MINFLYDLFTFGSRLDYLEKENLRLTNSLRDAHINIISLSVHQIEHLYNTYHVTKLEDGKFVPFKPEMSLETEFTLRRMKDLTKTRDDLSPSPETTDSGNQ